MRRNCSEELLKISENSLKISMMKVDFGRYARKDPKFTKKKRLNVRYLPGNFLKFSENYSFKHQLVLSFPILHVFEK